MRQPPRRPVLPERDPKVRQPRRTPAVRVPAVEDRPPGPLVLPTWIVEAGAAQWSGV